MNEPKSQQELIQLRKRARRRLVGAVGIVSAATLVLWNVIDGQPQTEMHPEKVDIVASGAVGGVRAPAPEPAPVAAVPGPATSPADALPPTVPAAEPVSPAPATPTAEPARPVPAAPEATAPKVAEPKPVEPKEVERKPDSKPAAKPADKPAEPAKEKKKPDPAAILNDMADADVPAPKPRAKADKPAQDKPAQDKADDKSAKSGRYLIQVAALSDPAKAAELKDKLAGAGVSASVSQVSTSKGTVSRIRVGPFASEAEARTALTKIQKAGLSGILVPQ